MRKQANRRTRSRICLAALVGMPTALICVDAMGQVSLTNGAYTQNFDTLPSTGTVTWTNNSTLPGWYMAHSNGTGSILTANDGGSNAGGLFSYGVAGVNPVTDRALGSIGSSNANNAGHFAYGAQFVNNDTGGGIIDSITITYTGEQWRVGDTGALQTMFFNYRVGGATWDTPPQTGGAAGSSANDSDVSSFANNNVGDLNFNSPDLTDTSNTKVDGNDPGNGSNIPSKRTTLTATIDLSNTPIVQGSNFWVRFYNPNHPGTDHGLAVDDFQISYHTTVIPGTDTAITAAQSSYDFGRVMATQTVPISLHKTGSQATSYSVTGQAGSNIANGGGLISAGDQDTTFNASLLGVGSFQGNVTVKNLATGSAGAGQGTADPDDVINVKADALNDRLVSATKSLGKALVGQSLQGSITFTTSGTHLEATDVTLPASSTVTGAGNGGGIGFSLAGTIFAGTDDRHFNDASVTETRNFSVTWTQSGGLTNTGVLTMSNDESLNGINPNPVATFTLTSTAAQPALLSSNVSGTLSPGSTFTITNAASDDNISGTGQNFGNRASARIIALNVDESGFNLGTLTGNTTTGTTIGGSSTFFNAATVSGTVSFAGATHLNGTYTSNATIEFQHTDQYNATTGTGILGTSPHDLAAQDMTWQLTANNTVNADPHTGTYTFTGGTYVAPASITLNGQWTQSGGSATFNTFNVNGQAIQSGGQAAISTLNIGATGSFAVSGARSSGRTNTVGALSITSGGKLDLGSNDMIVNNSSLPAVQLLLATGAAGGAWNGTGINSAAAAAAASSGHPTAIAAVTASSIGAGSFDGVSVNGTDVLLRYTYAGDSNADGVVTTADFTNLANNFGLSSGATWIQGDFNYDGKVNALDFNAIATNYGAAAITTPALGSVVPEPATLGLLGCAGLLISRRRRRD